MRSQLCAVPVAFAESGETVGGCEDQPGKEAGAKVGHLSPGPPRLRVPRHVHGVWLGLCGL